MSESEGDEAETELLDDGLFAWGEHDPYNPADDPAVQDAVARLKDFFREHRSEVFYEQQLAVRFEALFFHWVTKRALGMLEQQGRVRSEKLPLMRAEEREGSEEGTEIRFYRSPGLRSWKRVAQRKVKLVREFSMGKFGRALGSHAEAQFDAGLAGKGFVWRAKNVKKWKKREWPGSRNLDRVYERDGVEYGAEIKNTLGYIPRDELDEKLAICQHLKLRPLLIVRSFPKHYINMVYEAGGHTLIFARQLYPYGSERLAERVREELGLPTGREPAERHLRRFADWHEALVER